MNAGPCLRARQLASVAVESWRVSLNSSGEINVSRIVCRVSIYFLFFFGFGCFRIGTGKSNPVDAGMNVLILTGAAPAARSSSESPAASHIGCNRVACTRRLGRRTLLE